MVLTFFVNIFPTTIEKISTSNELPEKINGDMATLLLMRVIGDGQFLLE